MSVLEVRPESQLDEVAKPAVLEQEPRAAHDGAAAVLLPVHYDALGGGKPIVLQPRNGPCALIAMANALSLSGSLSLAGLEELTVEGLCQLLANAIIETRLALAEEVQVEDVLRGLMSMREGACVDPRFGAVDAFSPSVCGEAFALAGVPLLHGMLMVTDHEPLQQHSFDSCQDAMLRNDETGEGDSLTVGILRMFLEDHPGMVTEAGMDALKGRAHRRIAVLFHDAHFSVVTAIGDADAHLLLLRLVTDAEMVRAERVRWESFVDHGFYDAQFRPLHAASHAASAGGRRRGAKKAACIIN